LPKKRKMTYRFGNPFLTALQRENERNSSTHQLRSALDDESSFDHHKIPFVGKKIAPVISPSSTLDFDELDSSDMNISYASSPNSSLSVNFGLERCTLEKRQSNSSIGLPSSYPSFHSTGTCATYPEDRDDFDEFLLQFEKAKLSAKPALHPLLFSELPSPPSKTVTPDKPKRRRSGRNQVVITSTEDFRCMVSKSNQNRRRRNIAFSSTTEIEQAVREELSMGPISIEGKLTL
jgi:hypothetical protein